MTVFSLKKRMNEWMNENAFILDFIEAKSDRGGGNNWSYKMCKAPVEMSPTTNQHPVFFTS